MLRAFSTAATGMAAQQMMVDTIANNLANINTAGYKRFQLDFQDLMYVKFTEPGSELASGEPAPNGLEIGSGVRPAGTLKVFTQGEMEKTDRTFDVAIQGDGFFKITMPDGETNYTRSGTMNVNANGSLVSSTGYLLEPSISIPEDAESVSIGTDGSVTAFTAGGANIVGTISLVRFRNPSGLSNEGGNLLSETPGSGSPIEGNPGENGLGTLLQGHLERSNVQMVTELVNLITAQRAYEINSRAIRAGDEMLRATNQLIQ